MDSPFVGEPSLTFCLDFGSHYSTRTFDSGVGAWTTPDVYPGVTASPVSQKAYVWNNNNPVSYGDPTGYLAENGVYDATDTGFERNDEVFIGQLDVVNYQPDGSSEVVASAPIEVASSDDPGSSSGTSTSADNSASANVAMLLNDTAGLTFKEDHFWPRLSRKIGSTLEQVENAIWLDLGKRLLAEPDLFIKNPYQRFSVILPHDPTGPVTLQYRAFYVANKWNPLIGPYINIGTVVCEQGAKC